MLMTTRKSTLTVLLLTMLTCATYGQNLVPNPSFEQHTACPTGMLYPNDFNLAAPWYNPTACSPDLYDSCDIYGSGSGSVGVPLNDNGYQYPRSGHAYAGIMVYGSSGSSSVREYIQVELLDTLKANTPYCVSFYVNLTTNNSYHYAISEIGLLLSNNTITSNNIYYLNYSPQITSPPGTILTDTLNWTLVTGLYTASGGERYITIGNFKKDINTDTLNFSPGSSAKQSYYYIDDASITECSTGISDLSHARQLNFYPNPFNNVTTLEFDNPKNKWCIFTLYDLYGRLVRRISTNENRIELKRQDLVSGLYSFRLFNNTDLIGNGKLTIE